MDTVKEIEKLFQKQFERKKTTRENLDLDYINLFSTKLATKIFNELETNVEYEDPEKSKVKIFGKLYRIPRQQAAYGDPGMTYKFSGIIVPAKPWFPLLLALRKLLQDVTGYNFNFVLINRYKDGSDHMGEHKDDEVDLDKNAPIASLSFGETREFVLKHSDARKKKSEKRIIPLVKIMLQHGSLLIMNPPTNKFWYHSLPARKSIKNVRINLTFRVIKQKEKKM